MHNLIFVLIRRLHLPLIVLILTYAVSITGFVLIPGRDDAGQIWHMDFFHAFYFVSFMGTTIGFGEIPYPFTDGQRMWATFTIYTTVFAWLYAIGSLLSIIQDQAFQRLMRENRFRLGVKRLAEPFYLICGYGDTGSQLVKALTESNIRSVVIDIDQDRIDSLEIADLRLHVPFICADAAEPDNLITAGLKNRFCAGVVALTNRDRVNLKISISSKLLNPQLPVIARAESRDAEDNIASFGTDFIINPFDTFAGRLALALHSPGMYLLYEWMTAVPHEELCEPVFPPRGTWLLCGYGRFGKSVHDRLRREDIQTRVIEARPDLTGELPENSVVGRGTEANTLLEAKVEDAVGIVAGTDDDANNLSIIMTARELNPNLFLLARQNQQQNDAIFKAAGLDLVSRRGSIIAHKIFAIITTPLLGDFLKLCLGYDNDWANELVSRIVGVTGEESPQTWMLDVTPEQAPALFDSIKRGHAVNVGSLVRDPRNRDESLACIVMLIKRQQEYIMLPDDKVVLRKDDKILFCGRYGIQWQIRWTSSNNNVLEYILTGEEPVRSPLLRWLKIK